MTVRTKLILAYVPVVLFIGLDIWAFATGTYASDRDRVLPYYFAFLAFATMAPAIIAAHRDHSQFIGVWLVDLLGTPLLCIGWFAALIWAFLDPARRQPRMNTDRHE